MWLIDRDTDGLGGRRIPLPAPLQDALVRWYTGTGSRADEDAGITLVQNARIGAKWIACDCLAVGAPPPILTPAFLSEAETYYLRRLTSAKRPEHREDCPFFRDQVTHRLSEVRTRETPANPPDGYFEVLRPAPEKLAQRPDDDATDDRTRHASVPRLARLLWRLMDVAGSNRVLAPSDESEPPSIKTQFDALSRAAAKIEIAPGIELARAFWTHADALRSRRAYAVLRHLAKGWPRGHAPQGFLAVYSPNVRGHLVEIANAQPIQVANRVQLFSFVGNPVKGPFLVMIVAGEYPEAHGYAPLRAYAQPILSGHRFIPVDSDFERDLLRALLRTRCALATEGIDLVIERPVFDRLTPKGPYRPDFVIEARSRTTGEFKQLVLAVNAHGAPNGNARDRMQDIAPVLNIAEADVVDGTIFNRLRDALAL
jgi:hypothetical protein